MSIGRDLLNVPMGEMIREMAFAIAEAQLALDESGIQVAELMSGTVYETDDNGAITGDVRDTRVYFGKDDDGNPEKLSMMELGFTPTFYQFVDTLIEVKIAIKITREISSERKTQGVITRRTTKKKSNWFSSSSRSTVTTTPVDATYSSKYTYSAEGSSLLRTKLAPIPIPSALEERIRNEMERQAEAEE